VKSQLSCLPNYKSLRLRNNNLQCCSNVVGILVVCLCIIDTNSASAYIQRSNQSKSHKFFITVWSVAILSNISCKLPVVHGVCRVPGCIIELINASLGGV